QFTSAVDALIQSVDAGDMDTAQSTARSLDTLAGNLMSAQDQLVRQSAQDEATARQMLDATRAQVTTMRTVATALGLIVVALLVVFNAVYMGRPLTSLARQARRALRMPAQEMPEFVLDTASPRTAKELVKNLNTVVAQLREKYSELERANAGLHELNEEARSASQAKTAFVASISHELRTPLNTILGFSEMLLGEMYGPLTPRQRVQLERILRNG